MAATGGTTSYDPMSVLNTMLAPRNAAQDAVKAKLYAASLDPSAWETKNLLPVSINKYSGEQRLAIPGAVTGMIEAAKLPGDVLSGKNQNFSPGYATPGGIADALNFALNFTGTGSVVPRPAGSLGMGSWLKADDGFGIVAKNRLDGLKFRQDNPAVSRGATDWLMEKQENAERNYHRTNGITGATTAYFQGGAKYMNTADLAGVKGARNEWRGPGEHQFEYLMDQVKKNGWQQDKYPILVEVNHRGEAFVTEGNTRLAVARALGIPDIKVEFRYLNGGEMVEGPWNPDFMAFKLKTPAEAGRVEMNT